MFQKYYYFHSFKINQTIKQKTKKGKIQNETKLNNTNAKSKTINIYTYAYIYINIYILFVKSIIVLINNTNKMYLICNLLKGK